MITFATGESIISAEVVQAQTILVKTDIFCSCPKRGEINPRKQHDHEIDIDSAYWLQWVAGETGLHDPLSSSASNRYQAKTKERSADSSSGRSLDEAIPATSCARTSVTSLVASFSLQQSTVRKRTMLDFSTRPSQRLAINAVRMTKGARSGLTACLEHDVVSGG